MKFRRVVPLDYIFIVFNVNLKINLILKQNYWKQDIYVQ